MGNVLKFLCSVDMALAMLAVSSAEEYTPHTHTHTHTHTKGVS